MMENSSLQQLADLLQKLDDNKKKTQLPPMAGQQPQQPNLGAGVHLQGQQQPGLGGFMGQALSGSQNPMAQGLSSFLNAGTAGKAGMAMSGLGSLGSSLIHGIGALFAGF